MRLIIDVEANSLDNPTKIWCIVTKDLDTGVVDVYRNLTEDANEAARFKAVWDQRPILIGHNVLGWDFDNLGRLLNLNLDDIDDRTIDTLILSKLVDYPRDGHSIESYGVEFGFEKLAFTDFSKLSEEMVTYCTRDVEISEKIFLKYRKVINDPRWKQSILTEHQFQWRAVNAMKRNGFAFNTEKCKKLLDKVTKELEILDEQINKFPPIWKLLSIVTPKATKFGTIAQNSLPKIWRSRTCELTVGVPFEHGEWIKFNPSSVKQVVDLLWQAGWKPEDRTKTAILTERELGKLERDKSKDQSAIDLLKKKQEKFKKYGWKINENNLHTLPNTAPEAARTLARRILVESRRRTLTEWLNLVKETGRIHSQFQGIGAWTHRMAHQKPNMANIPNHLDTQKRVRYLGAEMRSLFISPRKRLLVGVDAAAIQLRIFAHYIDDAAFTKALVEGKKENKSDPHSLNKNTLGRVCRSRDAAKRYIFALLLGAGSGKLAEILECSAEEADAALQNIMERYTGFTFLKQSTIPADAKRGWFYGLDGRKVRIPGDTISERRHLAMSGYLQNGEAVIMKMATLLWIKYLEEEFAKPEWKDIDHNWLLVNLVHDEWQTECDYYMDVALKIAELQDKALQDVGNMLHLKCPLAGSYRDEDRNDYTIGTNWKLTH